MKHRTSNIFTAELCHDVITVDRKGADIFVAIEISKCCEKADSSLGSFDTEVFPTVATTEEMLRDDMLCYLQLQTRAGATSRYTEATGQK